MYYYMTEDPHSNGISVRTFSFITLVGVHNQTTPINSLAGCSPFIVAILVLWVLILNFWGGITMKVIRTRSVVVTCNIDNKILILFKAI